MPEQALATSVDTPTTARKSHARDSHRQPLVLHLSARTDLALPVASGSQLSREDNRTDTDPGLPFEAGSNTNPETDPDVDQPLFSGAQQSVLKLEIHAELYADGSWGEVVDRNGSGGPRQPTSLQTNGSDDADQESPDPDESIETGQGDTQPDVDPDIDTPLKAG